MGYVGRGLNQDGGQYRKLDSIATSFNGSETNFTLTIDGLEVTPTAQNLMISLGGVIQEPGTAFTVNGSTITFASAPADATTFFGVLMGEATFIARGTVGAAEMGITAGAVSASAGVVVDSSKNVIGFNEISASIFKGSFSGDTSSSINTRINSLVTDSGSFSTRITNATASINSISSSQATRTANLVIASSSLSASVATLKGSGTLQSVATNASPTFAGATITGTLTAQEIHTEFESASIIFSSGSTIFGDTSNDIHRMTGSLNVSGAINLNNGDLTMGANITMADDTSIGISDSAERIEFDGAGDISFLGANVGIGTNNPTKLLDIESSGTEASMDFTNDARTYRIGINDFGTGDDRLFFTDVTADATRLSIKADGTIHSHNSAIHITTDGTDDGDYNGAVLSRGVLSLNRDDTATVKQVKFHKNGSEHSSLETTSDGFNISGSKVGIGTRVPLAKMHVEHTTDDTDENGNIALTVGGGASGAVRHYWGINNSSNYAYYGAVEHATQYVPLVLQPNGSNVGIGTATVSSKLHIDNAIDQTAFFVDSNYRENARFHSTETNQGTRVWITNGSLPSNQGYGFLVGDGGGHRMTIGQCNSAGSFTHASINISGSHVGIGVTNPGCELDLFQATEARFRVRNNDDYSEFAQNSSGGVISLKKANGDTTIQLNSYGDSFIGASGGHLGVGGSVVNRGSMNKALEVHAGSDGEISITATDELSDDQRIGQFAFYTDKSYYNMACIVGRVSGTDENRGEMGFHTRGTESGGTPAERWRIKNAGHFVPFINNTYDIGETSERVRTIYAVNALNTSDRTLKKNINDCDLGLTFVNTLKPKSFYFNDTVSGSIEHDRKNYGLIAQDLMDTPLSDSVFGEKDGEYNLRYNDLFAPMIKAIQDLSKQVETLKAQVSGSN